MEEVIELVQQNWEKYNNNDLTFLEKLDKQQITMLFNYVKINQTCIFSDSCYKCIRTRRCGFYNKLPYCDECSSFNFINLKCKKLEKDVIDLKKHIIGVDCKGDYTCLSYAPIISTNIFPMQVKNLEWYLHCFGINNKFYKRDIKDTMIIFDLNIKLHSKFFRQCTRFNHYSRFQNVSTHNCKKNKFHYNLYQNESSVEMIMAIIDTARLVFRERRVPKCLRDLLIEWYLI